MNNTNQSSYEEPPLKKIRDDGHISNSAIILKGIWADSLGRPVLISTVVILAILGAVGMFRVFAWTLTGWNSFKKSLDEGGSNDTIPGNE